METQETNIPVVRPQKPNISFEEFEKLDIRVCKILSIEKVEKADKLYKMQIDTGIDKRIVVSAIANVYSPEDLLGDFFPFILNLEPRKIRGIESQAMIIMCETQKSNTVLKIQNGPLTLAHCPAGEYFDDYLKGAIII